MIAEYPSQRWTAVALRRRSGFPQLYGAASALPARLGARWVPAGTGAPDAPTLLEAAPDRRNNAHLVLHPIKNVDWSSGSESQK